MFRENITENSIQNLYPQIECGYINGGSEDCSLYLTSSLLLCGRMQTPEFKARIHYTIGEYGGDEPVSLADLWGEHVSGRDATFIVMDLVARAYQSAKDKDFTPEKYARDKVAEAWLRPAMDCLVFISPEEKRTVIVAENYSIEAHHLVQALFPRLFPWYFAEKPVTDEEIAFLRTLTNDDSAAYLNAVERMIDSMNLRIATFRADIIAFMDRQHEQQLSAARDSIDTAADKITTYMRRLEDAIVQHREAVEAYNRLDRQSHTTEDLDRVFHLLCNSDAMKIVNFRDGILTFAIKGFLLNFPEIWEAIERNEASVLYDRNLNIPLEDRKRLLHAIFVDGVYTLKMYAMFTFNVNSNNVGVGRGITIDGPFVENAMPNTHLVRYSCLGGYASKIAKYLIDGNIEGAFAQCAASVSSMNLAEVPVMHRFMDDLCNNFRDRKCVYTQDGEALTPMDAALRLRPERQTAASE